MNKTQKIFDSINKIGFIIGIPTPILHGILTVLFMGIGVLLGVNLEVVYGLAMGFYIGREVRDWEKLGELSHLEVIYPLIFSTTFYLLQIIIAF